jgi:hypothetical protein
MLHKSFIVYCRMSTAIKENQVSSYWRTFPTHYFSILRRCIRYPPDDFCGVLTGSRNGSDTSNEAHKRNSTDANNKQISESDSFIYKTLESMHDQEFCNLIQLPPEKVVTLCCYYIIGSRVWENSCTNFFHQIIQSLQVSKPCHLVISCLRSPIYIGGRYLKVCSVNPLHTCIIIHSR